MATDEEIRKYWLETVPKKQRKKEIRYHKRLGLNYVPDKAKNRFLHPNTEFEI